MVHLFLKVFSILRFDTIIHAELFACRADNVTHAVVAIFRRNCDGIIRKRAVGRVLPGHLFHRMILWHRGGRELWQHDALNVSSF